MLNKLKRSKKCNDASCPSPQQPRPTAVMTVALPESSCSGDGSASLEITDKRQIRSDVPAAGRTGVKPLPETFCAKGGRIAPVFLHAARHCKRKRASDGKPQESRLPPQTEDAQQVKRQRRLPAACHLPERKVTCRGQLSPSALHSCLEEIQTSNPAFPVRAVFSTLQRKTSLQESENSLNPSSPHNHLKEKMKQGPDSSERVPKRLRPSLITEGAVGMGHGDVSAQGVQEGTVPTARRQPRRNKLSRTHRLRHQGESPAGLVNNSEPYSELMNDAEDYSQSLKTYDTLQKASSFEDLLWTDKYSPQRSSEVIGNCASVNKLQSWLEKWKLRAVCDERAKMEERKREENSSDSWDCGDFQGEAGAEEDREEPLCNTMLITGPPGVGKTASVYACCQELGFKVFEVNCSSQRSGSRVLSQLKEATQSHLVDMSGKDPLKPAYFNNYSSAPKAESLPGKTVPLKNISTSKRKAAQSFSRSSRKGKANPAALTLANFFKMKAKADHLHYGGLSPSEKPDSKTAGSPSSGFDQRVSQNKKTATSLILFEEVDVIFDDDVGFLSAIKTFMTTTKRPVVLTTNDPSFRERFNCSLEEIVFKAPSALDICSYLQLVGLAENVRLKLDDVSSLLRRCRGDVRRCLLQLQLWVHGGGGRASQSAVLLEELTCSQNLSVAERGHDVDPRLPQFETGCTASMLGLYPMAQSQLFNLLKRQVWSEVDRVRLLRLLAESWRGGVPLLYSNLELLLLKQTSVHLLDKETCSGLQSELAAPDLSIQHLNGNVSLMVSATDSKSVRNISRLSRRKHITTMFGTTSSSSLRQTPQGTFLSKTTHSRVQSLRDEKAKGCLDALTDFFDLMSYLDATMPAAAPLVSGSCSPGAFVWTGAEIKDGLFDEMSAEEEEGRSWRQERLLDIQAAVEALGCHGCLWRVFSAQTEAQKYRQELGDTRRRRLVEQTLSFSSQPLCSSSVSQRRYELSRTVLGSNPFSLLGNRNAVSVDYMPVLRYICRFQRAQRHKEEPVRCPNYLSSKHLGLSKSTLQLLAEDFS